MLTGERPKDKIEAPSKRVQVDIRIDEIVLRALEKDAGAALRHGGGVSHAGGGGGFSFLLTRGLE
jgi:hypothetical protein